jgi:hypothetical protein
VDKPELKVRQRRTSPRRKPKGGTRVICRKGVLGLGPNVALSLLDLSEWGVCLLVGESLTKGQEVEVVLSAPRCPRDVCRLGDIVWSFADRDGTSRIGIRLRKRIEYTQLQDLGRSLLT